MPKEFPPTEEAALQAKPKRKLGANDEAEARAYVTQPKGPIASIEELEAEISQADATAALEAALTGDWSGLSFPGDEPQAILGDDDLGAVVDLETASAEAEALKLGEPSNWEQLLVMLGAGTPIHLSNEGAYRLVQMRVPFDALREISRLLGRGLTETVMYLSEDVSELEPFLHGVKPASLHLSERVIRLIETIQLAVDVFGSLSEARGWLLTPHPSFDLLPPLSRCQTSFGTQSIHDVLVAIKYGGVV